MTLDDIRMVAAALEVRAELIARWRAGDLDRLLNARHSSLHEAVARWFRARYPAWILAPEVTFAIYADRGVIDILGWHPGRRAILVIELKTDIVDVNAVMTAVDAAVLHRRFTGSRYNMVHGITITGITRPVEKNPDWTYYHSLDFALTTGWDEFEDLLAS